MTTPAEDAELGTTTSGRLVGAAEWCWYLVAAVSYIGLSIWHKWLLGWLVGPMWLVVTVCLGPPLLERVRRFAAPRRDRADA